MNKAALQDDYEQAQDEISALRHKLTRTRDDLQRALNEVAVLKAELEQAKADVARLQWLEQRGNGMCLIHDDDSRWACALPGFQPVTDEGGKSICDGPIGGVWSFMAEPSDWKPSLRAAIDEAMKGEK